VAALMGVAVIALGLFVLLAVSGPEAEAPIAAPADVAADLGEASVAAADAAVDPSVTSASAELQSEFEARKQQLPPEMVEPLAADLNLIESAIAEIGAALANDPENDSLKQMLVATYRNQLKVLKHALKIAGDDPEAFESD